MATGDSGCEAYTAIAWGVGLSHERSDIAGAEGFHSLEGNMCGTVMRGADALPGSKATSRAKGSHRNLGGLGLLTFPMRTVPLTQHRRPDPRPPRFRCDPFARDVAFDPGRASAPRIAVPHMLPSSE